MGMECDGIGCFGLGKGDWSGFFDVFIEAMPEILEIRRDT